MSAPITDCLRWASATFAGWRCTVRAKHAEEAERAVAHLGLIGDSTAIADGEFVVLVIAADAA